MIGIIKKIFGNKHEKDVKRILPVVDEINRLYGGLSGLSDEQLCAKTESFKELIRGRIAVGTAEAAELRTQLADNETDHAEFEQIHERLKAIRKEEFNAIQSALNEILPEAFAVVKETCRRLSERKHAYDVVGHNITWDMVPYDVQLIGGIVLHEGKISEMATGEGKTLVAVAPLYLNALSGKGVHLVTVNDYLARRDSEWMKPIFDFLGISVGCIQSMMQPQQRLEMYNADITYGTNNEFGFDYLRDNMVSDAAEMVQRPHHFAIVDEVDSVLVDEARTPLIISGPVGHSTDQKYDAMNPRVKRLVEAQVRLVNQYVSDAERLLKSDKKDERAAGGESLLKSQRGFPKNKRLMKMLQEPENQKLLRETELFYLRDHGMKMSEIDETLYYTIDEKNHQIDITEKGRILLTNAGEDPDLFLIPDIATEFAVLDQKEEMPPDEKRLRKDELLRIYSERSELLHSISQLLRAYSLYERDVEYVVEDGKVKIVDEFTGRILEGRRYSDGLHQAIEAKEVVAVEKDTQTYATVTLQNYFRLYQKLAGMTGTAETEAGEFESIYKLEVVVIPTNRPIKRDDRDDLIYRTKREKLNAVIEEIQRLAKANRAVLVGTTSVEVSEILSKMLRRANIPHNVLNAKQHQREAEIVAEAGREGKVTIATNMAGRGTDIKLTSGVKAAGGLAIIGTERHEARRIDRQLRGRAGRQGDPGTSQFFISLEDDLMRLFGGARIAAIMQRMKVPEGEPIQHGLITKSVENAQKKVEENNFATRKRLLEYDNVMNQQREAIYDMRRQALGNERMKSVLFGFVESLVYEWLEAYQPNNEIEVFRAAVRAALLCEVDIADGEFRSIKAEDCTERVIAAAREFYERKESQLGIDFMKQLERYAILSTIDDKWREHLQSMDELKEGIHFRAYGQKDPLLEYKGEAVGLYRQLIQDIQKEAVNFAFRYYPQVNISVQPPPRRVQRPAKPPRQQADESGHNVTVTQTPSVRFSSPQATPSYRRGSISTKIVDDEAAETNNGVSIAEDASGKQIGRNDLCPCGSGKKYKNCHGS